MTDIQKRRGLIAVSTILVLAALMRWLPPVIAEYALTSALQEQGFSDTAIGELDVNLYTGEIRVSSLSTRRGDGEPVELDNLTVDLDYMPFASSRIAIERISLDGLQLDARQQDNGKLYIANWPLPAPTSPPETETDSGESAPWLFGANSLEITNTRFSWADGKARTQTHIKHFTLSDLRGWTPDKDTPIDLSASVNGSPLALSGTIRPFAASPAATVKLSLQALDLTAFRGYLDGTGLDLRQAALSIDGLADITLQDNRPILDWQGRINLAGPSVAMESEGVDAVMESLAWDGQLRLDQTMDHQGVLRAEGGNMILPGIPSLTFAAIESDSQVVLSSQNGDMIASLANGLAMIKGDVATRIENLSLNTVDRVNIMVNLIQHDMGLDGAVIPDADRPLDIALRKQQDKLQITLPDYDLALDINAVDMRSDRLAFSKDITSRFGPSSVSGILLRDLRAKGGQASLLSLNKISISGGKLEADGSVEIQALALDKLSVLPGKTALAGFNSLTLSQILLDSEARAALGDITLDGLQANMLRDKNGDLPAIDRLTALTQRFNTQPDIATNENQTAKPVSGNAPPAKAKDIDWNEGQSTGAAPALVIGSFTLTGDNALRFQDLSVTPNVDITIDKLAAGFGRKGEEIQSLATKRTVFLKGRVGRGSAIDLSGTAIAGDIFQDLAVKGAIKNIDLYRVSPYVAAFLARNIKGGLLTDNIDLTIKDSQMTMANGLVVERLDFDELDDNQKEAAKDATDLPVELAVSVLSDSDDVIRLDLPVTGAVDNPDFDLSDVISKALGAALAGAAVATLTAFFPPTALLALGGALVMGEGEGGSMDLPPVQFEPGNSAMTQEGKDVVTAIDAMLTAKAGLRLQFCPRAVAADHETILKSLTAAAAKQAEDEAESRRQALIDAGASQEEIDAVVAEIGPVTLDPQLLSDLAQQRADHVYDAITASDSKHQDRLTGCRPVVDIRDQGAGRVDLTL